MNEVSVTTVIDTREPALQDLTPMPALAMNMSHFKGVMFEDLPTSFILHDEGRRTNSAVMGAIDRAAQRERFVHNTTQAYEVVHKKINEMVQQFGLDPEHPFLTRTELKKEWGGTEADVEFIYSRQLVVNMFNDILPADMFEELDALLLPLDEYIAHMEVYMGVTRVLVFNGAWNMMPEGMSRRQWSMTFRSIVDDIPDTSRLWLVGTVDAR